MSLQLTIEQTPTDELNSVLAPLAAAADAQDERAFLAACDAINWRQRTAEEFIQAIQWAFAAGAHMAARQLARLGAERHPDHGELQKYARILAPPQVIARNLPPDPSVQANRDWLMTQGHQFAGKWVAVRNGELLGVADSLTDLTTQFGIKRDLIYENRLMLLRFANGIDFAAGAMVYAYQPATTWESTPRIVIDVLIDEFRTSAFVDTGGVYLLCSPDVSFHLHLHPDDSLFTSRLLVRGSWLNGHIYRIPLTFPATEGNSLTIDALAFVPEQEENWMPNFPCVLGMQGCLERLRFAIDPAQDTFYFGELN